MTAPTRDPELEGFLAVSAARLAPRTIEAYRRDLVALSAWLGHSPATATREELEGYLAGLRAQGLAGSTIARRLASIRSLFRHQQLIGAREDNPAAEMQTCDGANHGQAIERCRGEYADWMLGFLERSLAR